MNRKRLVLCVVLVVVASLLLVGCGTSKTADQKPELITMLRSGSSSTLDPGYASSDEDIMVVSQLYEGLVRYKPNTFEIEPCLAESWESSPDGKVWTFNLRKNVKFHDGTPFNADAVVFSFKRCYDESHPMYGVGGQFSYLEYMLKDVLQDVKKIDDYTVEFTLKEPHAPFMGTMAYYSQSIVSPTAAEKHGKEFFKNPAGTGPYKLKEFKQNEYVSITANDEYWGGKQKIKQIVFKDIPEASARLAALQNGTAQISKNINPEQMETLSEIPNMEIVKRDGFNICYVAMNTKKPPFDNVKVRQAVNHAVNVDKLVKEIYQDAATRAVNPLPAGAKDYYNDKIQPYEYDPEKAKQLLAEAGYPNGLEIELWVTSTPRPYIPRPLDVAQAVANDLTNAGFKVKLESYEWGIYSKMINNGEHQVCFAGWIDPPEPNNYLNTMVLKSGKMFYETEELNSLAQQGLVTLDEQERAKIYKEMQQQIHDAAIMVPLTYMDMVLVKQKNLDINFDTVGLPIFRDAELK